MILQLDIGWCNRYENLGHSSHLCTLSRIITAEPTARVAPMLEMDLCFGKEAYTNLEKLLLDKFHSAKFTMCSSCVLPAVSNTVLFEIFCLVSSSTARSRSLWHAHKLLHQCSMVLNTRLERFQAASNFPFQLRTRETALSQTDV